MNGDMYKFIWRIRKEKDFHKYYRITLDRSSFGYETFPQCDRSWAHDNVEELINEAKEVVRINTQCDPYGKIWEHSDIIFDVDEEVIQEIRSEGEDQVLSSKGCLFLIMAVLIIILGAYCFF